MCVQACAYARVLPAALCKEQGNSSLTVPGWDDWGCKQHSFALLTARETAGQLAGRVDPWPFFTCRCTPKQCGQPKLMLAESHSPCPLPITTVHQEINISPVKGAEAKPFVSAPLTPDCSVFMSGKRDVICLNLHIGGVLSD